MLNLMGRWIEAVRQAKAESDEIVAEGRRMMHWPEPLSWREGWERWQGRSQPHQLPHQLELKQRQSF